jgi:hypothetical protein
MQADDRVEKQAEQLGEKQTEKQADMRAEKRMERAADKRGEWLRQLDEECPYQVVLPRGQSGSDSEIMKFLTAYVGRFDMYVEDEYAVFVRYCFADPLDAAIFRSRFEYRSSRFKLAG